MLPVRLRRARTHNLRGVDLDLPPGQLVALTGPSGSGKSSLALDTLYAEGQRRFVESFSPYARQFLERLERPPMDSLDPIAATVAVDRRAPVKSSRSTLATMTDLEPYLAALFACEAVPTCLTCGVLAEDAAPAEAAQRVLSAWEGAKAIVGYPVRVANTEDLLELRDSLARDGYRRLVVGGIVRDLEEVRPSEATAAGADVRVVIDRVAVTRGDARRLQQAIEVAWQRGAGRAELQSDRRPTRGKNEQLALRDGAAEDTETMSVVRGLVCPRCARAFEPARPGLFSYNSPLGACEACRGFGRVISVDWDKVFPDPGRPLAKGAIKPWSGSSSEYERGILAKFCKKRGIPMDVAWGKLSEPHRALVIEGEGTWDEGKYPGVRAWFRWLESRTYKMHVRVLLARYREYTPCGSCGAARLNATALSYRVGGKNLKEWHDLTVTDAGRAIDAVSPVGAQGRLVKEAIGSRLAYLERVGLGYLTLDRQARTLSGGEAQRAALTTALGASLTGTLFVLDEPTVGLHAADVPSLAGAMAELSRAGNTVLVVEHDETVVRACDRVIELGPGAGKQGGEILFDGAPSELGARTDLATGRAWQRARRPNAAAARGPRGSLVVRGARANNLHAVDVEIPLGVLCAITGPSGSGKSTLAEEIVYRAVARAKGDTATPRPGPYDAIEGVAGITRAILVDQSPLGRTARGNPATYTKAWNRIRARFAAEPAAAQRGMTPGHFSFNVGESRGGGAAGRCEACSGEGYETIEMQFLADVALLCPVCRGKRFRPEVLAVTHRGLDVSQVLDLTIDEALARFDPDDEHDPTLRRTLHPVARVGLGYLPLGQPLSMLSGGEAQRLKLARALSEDPRGALFVVDEPSAGLHAEDTRHVMDALRALTDQGASVIVVEHDLDVIRGSDWVIDLGPGAGPHGGRVVAEGPPAVITRCGSKTGLALRGEVSLATAAAPASAKSMTHDAIRVEHAREHNLRAVSCAVPHGALTVLTGPSGSGKSSLAFDVIFAEGQRRFMETLTPYARQFLPTLPRPDADRVTGVPPSIALEQRTTRAGANSTVATVTEIAHYLRLLYAKLGVIHCPDCGSRVSPSSPDEVFARLTGAKDGAKRTLLSPAVRARKGTYLDLFTVAARAGVQTARVDGTIVTIDPPPQLAKSKEHTVDLIVYYGRLRDLDRPTFDRALSWGQGAVRIAPGAPTARIDPREEVLSTARACTRCGAGVPELDPRWFSFNTKQGQCADCEGSGVTGGPEAVAEGETAACSTCEGTRLSTVPRRVLLGGLTYPALLSQSVTAALKTVRAWRFTGRDELIARAPHAELLRRLAFVDEVGLGYLALGRAASTLSGGEMQRLRLSAQLGSGLTGALYVLDEPTIGLHPRDTQALLRNLRALVETGSTVMVVEHDAETIRAADHLIDLGPGGGGRGGHIVAQGSARDVLSDPGSPTARALLETARVARPPRPAADHFIEIVGARAHNLKDVTLRIPTGRMVVVAGVSGSGKSTLVRRVFYPALRRALGLVADAPGAHEELRGVGDGKGSGRGRSARRALVRGAPVSARQVRRALAVDQSPIGRTPRSVPATFLGIWDDIRRLFASLPDAKVRGYSAARFSFNTASGGRCTACEGQGAIVSEMAFLPDVISPCETCRGARFEPATLDIRYGGRSIGEVLSLSAEEAAKLFAAHPRIARPLQTLCDLGLGYVSIGQGSNTLSGGEAQRLKLAAELTAGSAHEPTVYVLDEPTTGLHLADVRRLIEVLERLVTRGDTLVIIEHHPDVILSADWVIELGPGAGEAGGRIVFEGEPTKLVKARTPTGRFFAARSEHDAAPRALRQAQQPTA